MLGSTEEPSKNSFVINRTEDDEGWEVRYKFLRYKQLSEPNNCGFRRMSAMNTDMSHEYELWIFFYKINCQFLRGDWTKLNSLSSTSRKGATYANSPCPLGY